MNSISRIDLNTVVYLCVCDFAICWGVRNVSAIALSRHRSLFKFAIYLTSPTPFQTIEKKVLNTCGKNVNKFTYYSRIRLANAQNFFWPNLAMIVTVDSLCKLQTHSIQFFLLAFLFSHFCFSRLFFKNWIDRISSIYFETFSLFYHWFRD